MERGAEFIEALAAAVGRRPQYVPAETSDPEFREDAPVGAERADALWRMAESLLSRDEGYRFSGCTAHKWVDGHYIRDWANAGETRLDYDVTS